jgi:hypothetical protein
MLPATVVEAPEEIDLLAIFREMTPDGRAHLRGLLGLIQKPRG